MPSKAEKAYDEVLDELADEYTPEEMEYAETAAHMMKMRWKAHGDG